MDRHRYKKPPIEEAVCDYFGLEHLTGDRMSPAARFRLAAASGSDVPFFLWGGRALGLGRGEVVYPLPDLARTHCLVIFPGRSVSTAEAYKEAGRRLTKKHRTFSMENFGARPHFSPERVVGEPLDVLGLAIGVEGLNSHYDPGVEQPAPFVEQAAVGDLMSEGVLERVLQVREEARLV